MAKSKGHMTITDVLKGAWSTMERLCRIPAVFSVRVLTLPWEPELSFPEFHSNVLPYQSPIPPRSSCAFATHSDACNPFPLMGLLHDPLDTPGGV